MHKNAPEQDRQARPRTHPAEGYLRDAGATTIREPAIPTPAGLRRPDLLIETQDQAAVIDVQVVSDNADLSQANRRKISYYDKATIKEESRARLATHHPVEVGAATLNWR